MGQNSGTPDHHTAFNAALGAKALQENHAALIPGPAGYQFLWLDESRETPPPADADPSGLIGVRSGHIVRSSSGLVRLLGAHGHAESVLGRLGTGPLIASTSGEPSKFWRVADARAVQIVDLLTGPHEVRFLEPVDDRGRSVRRVDELGDLADHLAQLGDRCIEVFDCGSIGNGRPSTVVRVDGSRVSVVEPGVYEERYINSLRTIRVVFVCTGNTCRSPMAEAIARSVIETAARGSPAGMKIEVCSAGLAAMADNPMTDEAAQALRSLGYEPGTHRARPVTHALIEGADRIFTMTASHARTLAALMPACASRISVLDPEGDDVPDPIGQGQMVYTDTASRLESMIRRRIKELL